MIPAEAVDAAVSTLAEFTPEDEADSFDLKANDVWRGKVERILEAAAPYIRAQAQTDAWDEGYEAGSSDETDSYWGSSAVTTPNPYRAAAERGGE